MRWLCSEFKQQLCRFRATDRFSLWPNDWRSARMRGRPVRIEKQFWRFLDPFRAAAAVNPFPALKQLVEVDEHDRSAESAAYNASERAGLNLLRWNPLHRRPSSGCAAPPSATVTTSGRTETDFAPTST